MGKTLKIRIKNVVQKRRRRKIGEGKKKNGRKIGEGKKKDRRRKEEEKGER